MYVCTYEHWWNCCLFRIKEQTFLQQRMTPQWWQRSNRSELRYEDMQLAKRKIDWLICDWVRDLTVPLHLGLSWRALCDPYQFTGALLLCYSSWWPTDLYSWCPLAPMQNERRECHCLNQLAQYNKCEWETHSTAALPVCVHTTKLYGKPSTFSEKSCEWWNLNAGSEYLMGKIDMGEPKTQKWSVNMTTFALVLTGTPSVLVTEICHGVWMTKIVGRRERP